MLGFNPSAEHKVHQSIGVTGQQPKCHIGDFTRTPINVDNCHFGLWMPHTKVCDRRSPHRQSTPASKSGHTHSTMAFMDKGAQVQPEVATYAFPQLRRFNFIMMASQMLHGVGCQTNTSGQLPLGYFMQRPTTDGSTESQGPPKPLRGSLDASPAYVRRRLLAVKAVRKATVNSSEQIRAYALDNGIHG